MATQSLVDFGLDRLTRLSNSNWMTLKKQIEQYELRIVSLDVPTSWQALSDNMLIDLMAAMSHKNLAKPPPAAEAGN